MKEKIKLIIVFIIGLTISVVINVYAATVVTASEVSYTSNSQSTINGALNNLYTKTNTMKSDVDALRTRGCFTYTGTSNSSGVLTVTHNKNISSYYPVVVPSNTTHAVIPYAISSLSVNSFQVSFAKIDSFVLGNPGSRIITIFWCY